MLRAHLDAPCKQRQAVKRMFQGVLDEHGAAGITFQMVRVCVAVRRPEISREAGRGPEPFVSQTRHPEREDGVGLGDVIAELGGMLMRCSLSSLRLSYWGKVVHRVFASCGQETNFGGMCTHSLCQEVFRAGRSALTA